MMRKYWSAAVVVAVCVAGVSRADGPLPIFDTHVHYSASAWNEHAPAAVLRKLTTSGVKRALVSSTPDDGTLMLHSLEPEIFVPVLRPYRDGVNSSNWFRDDATPGYLQSRLRQGIYKGIGEFHLFGVEATGTEEVKRVIEMAVARDIVLHVHTGAAEVEALFVREPRLKILWAHAGMTEPPEVIGSLLDRFRNLWTELSFRAGDVLGAEGLDPAWRQLLLRHRDRFMIGTDTYVASRWDDYRSLVGEHRFWLDYLPKDTAKAIAYGNAVRLFGGGGMAWAE